MPVRFTIGPPRESEGPPPRAAAGEDAGETRQRKRQPAVGRRPPPRLSDSASPGGLGVGDHHQAQQLPQPVPHRLFPLPTAGHDGQLSPDGKWVACQAIVTSRWEIFVAPYSGAGERRLVSTDGGTEPLWSPDSRGLFFQNANRLMGVTVAPGATFSASSPQLVQEGRFLRTITGNTSFSISRDGARLLRVQPVDPEPALSHIDLVLNWFSAVTRRAAGHAAESQRTPFRPARGTGTPRPVAARRQAPPC